MSVAQLQREFLAMQPRILTHAQIACRHLRCSARRADYVAEVIALCWKWFRSLAQRNKDARRFVSVLASYAARAVRSGRRVCGQLKAQDVLSERAQRRHDFHVERLATSTRADFHTIYSSVCGQHRLDALEEQLQHNLATPIPDQIAFRLDFPAWLLTRTERDRRLIRDMMRSERTLDLAKKYGISPARVSQLRRHYLEDWTRYCADVFGPMPAPRKRQL
jgi:hypothetical protein